MIYAGFFRRLAALLVDTVILTIPSLILGSSTGFITSFGVGILVTLVYKPVFESSVLNATPGKALLGIAVVSESGEPISFKSALVRFLSSYISVLIAYMGYLIQPFTKKQQTLHDMISETVVIRKEAPDLNYFIVWKDQLKYIFSKL